MDRKRCDLERLENKWININEISLPDWKTFKEIDQASINKISYSIEKNGQTESLLVREVDRKYEIIDGIIRYRLFQKLNIEEINCFIMKDCSKEKAMLLSLQSYLSQEFDILRIAKFLNHLMKHFDSSTISAYSNFEKKQIEKYAEIYDWDWSIFDQLACPDEFRDVKNQTWNSLF